MYIFIHIYITQMPLRVLNPLVLSFVLNKGQEMLKTSTFAMVSGKNWSFR